MNTLTIADFQAFIDQYWQKQPVVIKGAFSDFEDPLDPNELAGLAFEEEVDSRVVSNNNGDWQVKHGPFEDFEAFGETHWSLLVQGVNYLHPEAQPLVDQFKFIPEWRLEDLMVSFSTPGGGVGPHTDQYDVFIIQGMGKRRWRVGAKTNPESFEATQDLLHVDQFKAIVDEVLEPGDLLYIPPGAPHEGETIETAMNYSVGFRAQQQSELLSGLADHVLQSNRTQKRYSDPSLKLRQFSSEISADEIAEFKQLISEFIEDDDVIRKWLGESLSKSIHELDMEQEPLVLHEPQIMTLFKKGYWLQKINGVRCLTLPIKDDQMTFYVEGEEFCCSAAGEKFVKQLLAADKFTYRDLKALPAPEAFIPLILGLIELGFWEVMEP